MNRSAKQLTLFEAPDDYDLFLQVLVEAEDVVAIRLLEYCVMPNHWHLLVWPERDDDLSRYMRSITGVHGQRWRRALGQPGKGAVYQGRFRWVAVQDGDHYDVARRYIQQNPVRAGLVEATRPMGLVECESRLVASLDPRCIGGRWPMNERALFNRSRLHVGRPNRCGRA